MVSVAKPPARRRRYAQLRRRGENLRTCKERRKIVGNVQVEIGGREKGRKAEKEAGPFSPRESLCARRDFMMAVEKPSEANGTARSLARWMHPCQVSRGQSRATPLFGSSRGATPCAFTFASDNDRRVAGNVKIASRNRLQAL